MQREAIVGDQVFVIRGFLSPEECSRFIAEFERIGFSEAPVTTRFGAIRMPDIRDNDRLIVDDTGLAAHWFERATPFLPRRIGSWELSGLNERFRSYRYDPGQSFKRHLDGYFRRPDGERSLFTFMAYLNDDFDGGTTAFYDADQQPIASIVPEQGMALVFRHAILHEGNPVEQGRKYVLRTDVMYRNVD
ncbi:prolyl hydroxylase family protein [Tautonia rosea]|uniref:prolyl hydroxylase family protein n=1 Tax=Tautonia rosea TaxID=2728037 RepID=UPI00147513C9|nr:2OG-Fe(II) oxygenase [Tautonia rosea]